MEFLSKIPDITKLPTKFLVWVASISGLYLFLPEIALEKLHLSNFPPEYKAYVGLTLVASLAYLFVNALGWLWRLINRGWQKRRHTKMVTQALQQLDKEEVAVLREFLIQGQHVIELPIDHPTVAGLLNVHVLEQASRSGYRNIAGSVFSVRISAIAYPLVTADLLFMPHKASESEIEKILHARPHYMQQIERTNQSRGGL